MPDSLTLIPLARLLDLRSRWLASAQRCLIGDLSRQAPFARLAGEQADFAIKNQFQWNQALVQLAGEGVQLFGQQEQLR